MPSETFESFKAELNTLKNIVDSYHAKTIQDENLRDRFRILYRSWFSVVKPDIETHLRNKRDYFKLNAELELIANLASKRKSIEEYKKRINKSIELANSLVIYLPIHEKIVRIPSGVSLFIPDIPDLPTQFVPNALLGWKSNMESFLRKHPYDKSVFLMIRYRKRNKSLLQSIKQLLKKNNLNCILASDHQITDDLYNPIACLLCCSRGIAVFDRPESNEKFNPNVAYELGMFHLLGRNFIILKNNSLISLHTDILMKLYQPYSNKNNAALKIEEWLSRKT